MFLLSSRAKPSFDIIHGTLHPATFSACTRALESGGGNVQLNCNQSKICLQGANNVTVTDPSQSMQLNGKFISAPHLQLWSTCSLIFRFTSTAARQIPDRLIAATLHWHQHESSSWPKQMCCSMPPFQAIRQVMAKGGRSRRSWTSPLKAA